MTKNKIEIMEIMYVSKYMHKCRLLSVLSAHAGIVYFLRYLYATNEIMHCDYFTIHIRFICSMFYNKAKWRSHHLIIISSHLQLNFIQHQQPSNQPNQPNKKNQEIYYILLYFTIFYDVGY